MTIVDELSHDTSIRRGMWTILVGVGGFLLLSLFAQIDGAVVATGQLKYAVGRQVVQHPDGGVVRQIHVRNGAVVDAGDPIVTLDGVEIIAQRAILERQLHAVLSQMGRLRAEALGLDNIDFDGLIDAEDQAIFDARRYARLEAQDQLLQRQQQAEAIAAGRERQLVAVQAQKEIVQDELAEQNRLLAVGLTQASRVSALEREEARLASQIAEIEISMIEANGAAEGYFAESVRLLTTAKEAAQTELGSLTPKAEDLKERLQLVQSLIDRLVIRAPVSGIVTDLQVDTVGGVVPSGADIVTITPIGQPRIISAEVDPTQIDRVYIGQSARIRFPSVDANATPEVEGVVRMISPDTLIDAQSGRPFYAVEVSLQGDLSQLPAGVPAQVLLKTGPRTIASYLTKPIADYWTLGMRER